MTKPTGTIIDTLRAAMLCPKPNPEIIKRVEEFKRRKSNISEKRINTDSDTIPKELEDLSSIFND